MGPEAPITESSGNVSFNGDGGALTYTNQPHSHYLQRPGLTTVTVGANTYLLAGFSSSCDAPTPYYGWLVSMNVTNPVNGYTNGMSPAGVYCSTCSAQTNGDAAGYPGGTIWQSGAAPAVDGVNVFVETANGNYDAGSALSDSLVRLTVQSDGSLTVSDYFTPSNEVALAQYDYDLGSASPMILPGSMVLAGSKTGTLYLTNELALGGYQQGPSGSDNVLSEVQASCPQTTGWTPSTNCFNVQLAVDATPDGNWAQLHGAGVFWAEQNYAYYEGQWDTLRRVPIDLLNKTIGTGADAGVGDLVYQPYANPLASQPCRCPCHRNLPAPTASSGGTAYIGTFPLSKTTAPTAPTWRTPGSRMRVITALPKA